MNRCLYLIFLLRPSSNDSDSLSIERKMRIRFSFDNPLASSWKGTILLEGDFPFSHGQLLKGNYWRKVVQLWLCKTLFYRSRKVTAYNRYQRARKRGGWYLLSHEVFQHGWFASGLSTHYGNLWQIQLHVNTHLSERILQFIDNGNERIHVCKFSSMRVIGIRLLPLLLSTIANNYFPLFVNRTSSTFNY